MTRKKNPQMSKLDKKETRKMLCVNHLTCKDDVCSHKKEHDKNGACEQSCIYCYGEKTCAVVERKINANKNGKNISRRVTNPRLSKYTVSSKAGKAGKTSKCINK